MENIQKLILQRKIEDINTKHYDLEREINLLFDEIQYNLTETVMFDCSIVVSEESSFDSQTYNTKIFGITKEGLLSIPDDYSDTSFDEVNEQDLTEVVFDNIYFSDKIYLLEHIIDNLKD